MQMVEVRVAEALLAHVPYAAAEQAAAEGRGELVTNRRKTYLRLPSDFAIRSSSPMNLPAPRSRGGWEQHAERAKRGVGGGHSLHFRPPATSVTAELATKMEAAMLKRPTKIYAKGKSVICGPAPEKPRRNAVYLSPTE